MNPTNAIVQLNKYDREKYNVLVPVTTMQVASNLQRITVSEVQLDVRQNSSNNGPSKDIYYEKSSNAYAITKVGGMKLAAAANISIVSTTPGEPRLATAASKWREPPARLAPAGIVPMCMTWP